MNRLRAAFQGRSGSVLTVSLIVWTLALFDLTVLPRGATEYLGTLPPKQLADATVTSDPLVLTSTDPAAPADLWILSSNHAGTRVLGVPVPPEHTHRGRRDRTLEVRTRTTVRNLGGKPVDVEDWERAGPVLFVVSSPRRSPSLRLISLRVGRPLLERKVPLPPQRSDRRDFFVARWSGPRPDLFVIDRNVNRQKPLSSRPWLIRIYTGESGFGKLAAAIKLRRKLSKQLSSQDWWLDIGTRRRSRPGHRPKPGLVLVSRERETGTGQTEVHFLTGSSRFRYFSLHSGTELPVRAGLTRRFVLQSEPRGGSLLMVKIEHGHLSLVPVPLP